MYLLGMSHVSQVRCYISTAAVVPSVLCCVTICAQRASHMLRIPPHLQRAQQLKQAAQPGAAPASCLASTCLPACPLQVSCDHIRELVGLVRPEVVMVEVCKDRLALLVDPDKKAKDLWVCRKVGGSSSSGACSKQPCLILSEGCGTVSRGHAQGASGCHLLWQMLIADGL